MPTARQDIGESRSSNLWRIMIIVVSSLVLLWLSISLTTSLVLGRHQSAKALRIWPAGAEAAARRSADLLASPNPARGDILAARQLAANALAKEPANAVAARDLGLVYSLQGKANEALEAFAYSERISRRDVPTQMWLIEAKVQAGDVAGALIHYDRAMRTSVDTRELLLPTLVGAAQDPFVAAAVKKVVAARPNWWVRFTDVLVGRSEGASAIGNIVPALKLDPTDPDQARQLSVGLRHMVDLGEISQAYDLYRKVRRFRSRIPLLRGGDFEVAGQLAPFEWQLADAEERQGVREARDGSQGRFALSLYGETAGEVARQLMILPPGEYRVSGMSGSVSLTAPQPSIAVVCAKDASVLANVALPRGRRSTFARRFQVSAHCPAQYVFISIAGSLDHQAEVPWIDSVNVSVDSGT